MFSKITKELETYTGEKNKAKIAALKKALGNYPTILGTIEPSIDDLNTKIMNGLNEFSKLTNMKGNGLFYLIDPKGGVNTIDLLISNIIITIQRRIIMMDGKENAKDDKFKVEEYYGKPGKKFKKIITTLNSIRQYNFFGGKTNAIALAHLINAKVIPNCIGNIWVYVYDCPENEGRSGKFNLGKQNITWTGGKKHPDPNYDNMSKYLRISD
ncbi:hypothetical protein EDI_262380 [Entamoeba dispar SAW760]|uniref:Uncharacterized protein n=1 Tax=Entamoeba dispar (strain ATCC PRA-260 / SAW760) TaxID=370354 RepID=B0E9D4_ENTDS|nr:uncharacterized protein EDI_262380 [Entamoeba dispar SAW760]EDR28861.1 hypothetical protein EDI_262380 [Entamoeba dispar SAW760]|eukprot:EDR28861.1 hypothetical protein EDI_262380 [Entamoeba dispar SAW760]